MKPNVSPPIATSSVGNSSGAVPQAAFDMRPIGRRLMGLEGLAQMAAGAHQPPAGAADSQ